MPLVVSIYIIYSYLYVHSKAYTKQFSSSRGDGRKVHLWCHHLSINHKVIFLTEHLLFCLSRIRRMPRAGVVAVQPPGQIPAGPLLCTPRAAQPGMGPAKITQALTGLVHKLQQQCPWHCSACSGMSPCPWNTHGWAPTLALLQHSQGTQATQTTESLPKQTAINLLARGFYVWVILYKQLFIR